MTNLYFINRHYIALAMETSNEIEESIWCLDTDTGEVVNVFEYVIYDIEEGNEESIRDYPDWMKELEPEDVRKD